MHFYQSYTIENDLKILAKQLACLRVDTAEATIMTEREFRELEVQIARYRILEREVTDPLAGRLLHSIVLELEADLKAKRERSDS